MSVAHQSPIDVVWRREDFARVIESRFLHDLLARGVGRPMRVIFRDDRLFLADNMLAVVLENDDGHLEALRRQGCKGLGLLHLGDEQGRADRSFYRHADYVLRHYYFPDIVRADPTDGGPPVVWLPNGYRNGLGPRAPETLIPASERGTFLFFSGMTLGASAPARQKMIDAAHNSGLPCALFGSRAFGGGFPPMEYAARLENSAFGLTPSGNSPETIRLYDCLELGTIPVMLRADFLDAADALGGAPFPILNDWSELAGALSPFLDRGDPAARARIDGLQREVVNWWRLVKARKAADAARTILRGRVL